MAEGTLEVPGLVDAEVHSTDEVWELLKAGGRNRAVGSTNANLLSSRSHWYQMILCFFFPSISYYSFVRLFDQRKQNLKYLQYFMLQKIEYSFILRAFYFHNLSPSLRNLGFLDFSYSLSFLHSLTNL